MSRQMPRVGLKWVGRRCISIVTLRHAYPMPRLSVHHLLRDSRWKLPMKKIPFYPIKTKKLNSTSTTKTKTNKYTRRLRYTWRTLIKLKNTKNWSAKSQRINTQLTKTKTIKYTRRLRYITSTWITLLKLSNTKNWTWRNTKQT